MLNITRRVVQTLGMLASGAMIVWGCAAVKPACLVINAANDVCNVVSYVEPDGAVQQEPVPAAELANLARTTRAKRLALHAPDGGDAGH